MATSNPTPPKFTPQDVVRFWSRIDKSPGQGPKGDCWEWQGGRDKDEYGVINMRPRRKCRASRVVLFLTTGVWPSLSALHHCDNPPCCRPGHVFEGTGAENMQDAARKHRLAVGVRNSAAKLTENEVQEIRQLYAQGRYSHRYIADLYSVGASTVRRVVNRQNWIHVP